MVVAPLHYIHKKANSLQAWTGP